MSVCKTACEEKGLGEMIICPLIDSSLIAVSHILFQFDLVELKVDVKICELFFTDGKHPLGCITSIIYATVSG